MRFTAAGMLPPPRISRTCACASVRRSAAWAPAPAASQRQTALICNEPGSPTERSLRGEPLEELDQGQIGLRRELVLVGLEGGAEDHVLAGGDLLIRFGLGNQPGHLIEGD